MLKICGISGPFIAVVAEKPKAAARIAAALGSPSRCRMNGVPVYAVLANGQRMIIVSAAGHLFGPTTLIDGLPVTELRWEPLWRFEEKSKHLRSYYEVLAKVLPLASGYVSACDYDIEGSTICYKIIEAFGDIRRSRRAKFSSLTAGELRRAFQNLLPLDVNNAMAGIARAELDWLWGINFSRLLMRSYTRAVGKRLSLSAGRVQTPTLAEAVRRWIRRNTHVPVPAVSVSVELEKDGLRFRARPEGWGPKDKEEAVRISRDVRDAGFLTVRSYTQRREEIPPPPPFNLTDLQEEAARVYKISPYRTQEIAEDLYTSALISYPRTESQRLPRDLDYRAVLSGLSRQREYAGLVSDLMRETRGVLRPVEGHKTDPAHPAIYPTGEAPREQLDRYHRAIYDLVVRRFMAAFAPAAMVSRTTVIMEDRAGRLWRANGLSVLRPGWLHYYPFSTISEESLPVLSEGERVAVASTAARVTWPGSTVRLSRMALVEWMESNDLGTKGTRARIVETLVRRRFLEPHGGSLEVTELGYAVYKTLSSMVPELVSVDLTRDFERKLELIVEGKMTREQVVSEAKKYVEGLVNKYLPNAERIGLDLALRAGHVKPEKACPICGRPAEGELCELHEAAKRQLEAAIRDVCDVLGVSPSEALRLISTKRSAGRWTREVAAYLLRRASVT